jgi:hypothetical protein
VNTWQKGGVAAIISGAAGGVTTGLASIGISPQQFNLVEPGLLFKVMATAAAVNALIGLAAYLKQSPVPPSQ